MKDMKEPKTQRTGEKPIDQEILEYVDLMRAEQLEELEIKQGDFKLHLVRKGKAAAQPAVAHGAHPAPQAAEQPKTAPASAPAGLTVQSPLIGVFYQSPSPASPPFAKEDDSVEVGKTLCIVEAMKVMNEIKAEYRMKILKVLVENGKPVVKGQDLFLVEKV